MKRVLSLIVILSIVLALTACGTGVGTVSGLVVSRTGGLDYFFEMTCENGKSYAFLVTESTELIYEDKGPYADWYSEENPWGIFGAGVQVTVVAGETAESVSTYVDECVEGWYYAEKVTVTGFNEDYFSVNDKPVIYLYPETTTDVEVRLDYQGQLTCTYPAYKNGWHVTAQPDGTLTDAAGKEYNYLYWEGITPAKYDFSKGFCIAGKDTASFLETALAQLGLSRREANEFIVYWLPLMEKNGYNLISFQSDIYTDSAKLEIYPKPDTLIRVFMAWKSLDEPVQIEPQSLDSPERRGFTVVEWGGSFVS